MEPQLTHAKMQELINIHSQLKQLRENSQYLVYSLNVDLILMEGGKIMVESPKSVLLENISRVN